MNNIQAVQAPKTLKIGPARLENIPEEAHKTTGLQRLTGCVTRNEKHINGTITTVGTLLGVGTGGFWWSFR